MRLLALLRGALATLKDAPALLCGRLPTLVLLSVGVSFEAPALAPASADGLRDALERSARSR